LSRISGLGNFIFHHYNTTLNKQIDPDTNDLPIYNFCIQVNQLSVMFNILSAANRFNLL